MFIESKYSPQEERTQRPFAIVANDNLIEFLKTIVLDWDDAEDIPYYKEPVIIVTEEEQLEGWRWIIEEKVKEAFLRSYIDDFPLCEMDLKEDIFASQESIEEFFNMYFELIEGKSFHVLDTGTWRKTKEKTEQEDREGL